MEKEIFPWREHSSANVEEIVLEKQNDFKADLQKNIRKFAPLYILLILVLLILVFRPIQNNKTEVYSDETINVLVVMLPTPKGSEIFPETLKAVPVREKSFTKTQSLQVIRIEDVSSLRGKIVAKKNLPPNKPLYWSDIVFKVANQQKRKPQILYPKENL